MPGGVAAWHTWANLAMTTLLKRAADSILDLVFPRTCAVCQGEGSFLHEGCEKALPVLQQPYCRLCASPGAHTTCSWCQNFPPSYEAIAAPYLMDGAVRDLVHSLKYENLRASAPDMGRLMARNLARRQISADVLAPVPLHRRRERQRGYNQSLLLAREIAVATGVPARDGLLVRTLDTPPQVSMSGHEKRRRNIEGAFECAGDVSGLKVLLIDDVVTTGATMEACARPLKAAGARSVSGLAFARQA